MIERATFESNKSSVERNLSIDALEIWRQGVRRLFLDKKIDFPLDGRVETYYSVYTRQKRSRR